MKRVLVPLAPGFEEVEASIVVGLLRRMRIAVTVAGEREGAIEGMQKLVVVPEVVLDDVDSADFDMLVLLGGNGARALKEDTRLRRIVLEMAARDALLAAICSGPLVLAEAGVLAGRRVTSSPSIRDELIGAIYSEDRVVVDGNIITSRLPGTAMEFTFKLIELLCSKKHADYLATQIAANY